MKPNFSMLILSLVVVVLVSSCTQYAKQTQTSPSVSQPTKATAPPQQETKLPQQPTTTTPTKITSAVKEFSITADDSSYSPSGPINVNKGDTVKITFNVKTSGVRFGGLDFRSSEFDTGTIKPGNSKTVEFVADKSFSIASYWPGSNTKKPYTIQVAVQ